ncbi:hypothetical protein [Haladaptatus sp. DFWS20]|uniref:hypothetical protein n=1 Tax=Haladaptatus sp. DFWS20 TaxID=3403467 RepID=UPI003EB6C65A
MAIPAAVYLTGLVAVTTMTILHNNQQNFVGTLADSLLLGHLYLFVGFYTVFSLLFHFLLIPVYSYGLYKDMSAVRDANVEWTPNSRLWTGIAIVHLLAIFVVPVLFTVPAGMVYLYKRHRYLGTP